MRYELKNAFLMKLEPEHTKLTHVLLSCLECRIVMLQELMDIAVPKQKKSGGGKAKKKGGAKKKK